MYGYFFKNHTSELPTVFFATFVTDMIIKDLFSPVFVYAILVYHIEEVILRHNEQEEHWIGVTNFLQFILNHQCYKQTWYDKALVKKLIAYLTKINKKENLAHATRVLSQKALLLS